MSIEHLAKQFLSPVVPVMEESDVITNLRAENATLVERLRVTPDLRETIAELRLIESSLDMLNASGHAAARRHLAELLRRLDREPHEGTQ